MPSSSFITRHPKNENVRSPAGLRIRKYKSDITVTKLDDGSYRCYNCPFSAPTATGNLAHRLHSSPDDMLLHVVDHLMAGHAVPSSESPGMFKLIAKATRWSSNG